MKPVSGEKTLEIISRSERPRAYRDPAQPLGLCSLLALVLRRSSVYERPPCGTLVVLDINVHPFTWGRTIWAGSLRRTRPARPDTRFQGRSLTHCLQLLRSSRGRSRGSGPGPYRTAPAPPTRRAGRRRRSRPLRRGRPPRGTPRAGRGSPPLNSAGCRQRQSLSPSNQYLTASCSTARSVPA